MRRRPTWALIAGGGTAGHVVPALSVAQVLVQRGHPADSIHFVGSRRGMEARMVPAAGFGVTLLPGRGLNERKLNLENLRSAASLAAAAAGGLGVVARRRPAVVLSVGGYASLAPGLAAGLTRRPLVLHEQNAMPGAVNRITARFARASAVSLPGTPLPRPVLTGNPIGADFEKMDRSGAGRRAARERLGLPEGKKVLAAWGGSLGARRINLTIKALVEAWAGRDDLAVHHVIGRRDFGSWTAPKHGLVDYRAVEYEPAMSDVMLAADVAVCRAGGMTVAELAVAGLPAILVPLPIATEDHQMANARALVDAGGALVIRDGELDESSLAGLLAPLLGDDDRRVRMADAAAAMARPDAAQQIAELMETHALW
ncbi:MAG TPA: UDP-N-acetylglucosamine--N-acetylmuramyl-(pentapeptide) pyrophosphoryl-undecaprenol N-acetylglucosamine transferase [Acidimicrobiales bacterium]|nr:UDP-N-acetylglucosamine--N-acetylmuramyl-(pentapeptide) pyrophosphoryl-undecaprenol N-acetylglucosamine transferase [Acidimicrobiales bacterium]